MVKTVLLTLLLGLVPHTADAAERLPLLARPVSYELEFTPDLTGETFAGRATIAVRIVHPTSHIVLHAAGLTFESVTIQSGDNTLPASVQVNADDETATLRVARTLRPASATIRIAFRGRLNRDLRGFYVGKANGEPYAATQLEATDARRPCAVPRSGAAPPHHRPCALPGRSHAGRRAAARRGAGQSRRT